MKTSEFIKKVEEFGYKVLKSDSTLVVIKVISEKHSRIYGYVFNTDSHKIETTQYTFQDSQLFDLIVEYARTPLEERREPKKYFWKLKGTGNNMETGTYFNKNPNHDKWILGAKNGVLGYLTRFTEMQFHELHTNLGITLEFDREEI